MLVTRSTGRIFSPKSKTLQTRFTTSFPLLNRASTDHRGDRPSSTFWKQAFRFSGAVCPVSTQCRNVHRAKVDVFGGDHDIRLTALGGSVGSWERRQRGTSTVFDASYPGFSAGYGSWTGRDFCTACSPVEALHITPGLIVSSLLAEGTSNTFRLARRNFWPEKLLVRYCPLRMESFWRSFGGMCAGHDKSSFLAWSWDGCG